MRAIKEILWVGTENAAEYAQEEPRSFLIRPREVSQELIGWPTRDPRSRSRAHGPTTILPRVPLVIAHLGRTSVSLSGARSSFRAGATSSRIAWRSCIRPASRDRRPRCGDGGGLRHRDPSGSLLFGPTTPAPSAAMFVGERSPSSSRIRYQLSPVSATFHDDICPGGGASVVV